MPPFPKKRFPDSFFARTSFLLDVTLNFNYLFRWSGLALLVGALAGSASALFLVLLDWATEYRESHLWIIALLPVGGLLVGWMYHRWGQEAQAGNNLLLQSIQTPSTKRIPWIMAPLVLIATVLTHLVGGSAGREGTAVQMGGAMADQLTPLFKLRPRDRKMLLICGVSAGFASVFGTPLAGAVFALEVFLLGQLRYNALVPSFLAAVVAHAVTTAWGVGHTQYPVVAAPALTFWTVGATLVAGISFALAARLFSWASHAVGDTFRKYIAYPPLRPVVGGAILALLIWLLGTTKYIGLGIPTIVASFAGPLPSYDFLLKLFLTALTLGCGFKGGEVTPLFFIGATLGNALFPWLPLPLEVLAAMGFVAVFAGAANTPLACTLMAMELFGTGCGIYAGLACVVAYLFSGHTGIYGAQVVENSKHPYYVREAGTRLAEIRRRRF
ncbi:voltage-gated chloride channel family protein [Rufibacter sediminis]|uniref:Voltage-gated chloride channel family protein n=1 Tax=Rufibacter sediminis TaxID=2762756 RepID=A0ABR6VWY1_9BACT|nr:voltage-gated chloride channel family protein [Rufibacter sediminis]MBC3541690.1 voltage-gated chloride channel family protein [Rufibacter sediminis]